MIQAIDVIDLLPFELQARLENDDYFADIPVVVAEEGNIKAELARKQAVMTTKSGKRGVAVIVLQVVADDDIPNLAFGPMTLMPAFQVVENLELNRDANGTGKSARKVSRRIRDVVKGFGAAGLVTDMKAGKPCIEPVPLVKELGELVKAYQVNFRCLEVPQQGLAQAQMPVCAAVAGPTPQFEITSPTDAARIYWTSDDSYPGPQNPGAKVYESPIAIPDGGITVRACAYAQGLVASRVQRQTITIET